MTTNDQKKIAIDVNQDIFSKYNRETLAIYLTGSRLNGLNVSENADYDLVVVVSSTEEEIIEARSWSDKFTQMYVDKYYDNGAARSRVKVWNIQKFLHKLLKADPQTAELFTIEPLHLEDKFKNIHKFASVNSISINLNSFTNICRQYVVEHNDELKRIKTLFEQGFDENLKQTKKNKQYVIDINNDYLKAVRLTTYSIKYRNYLEEFVLPHMSSSFGLPKVDFSDSTEMLNVKDMKNEFDLKNRIANLDKLSILSEDLIERMNYLTRQVMKFDDINNYLSKKVKHDLYDLIARLLVSELDQDDEIEMF